MPNFVPLKTRLNGEVFLVLNTGMPEYILNLDAPEDEELADDMLLPAPDMVLNDYLPPHAAEIEQLTAFVR